MGRVGRAVEGVSNVGKKTQMMIEIIGGAMLLFGLVLSILSFRYGCPFCLLPETRLLVASLGVAGVGFFMINIWIGAFWIGIFSLMGIAILFEKWDVRKK